MKMIIGIFILLFVLMILIVKYCKKKILKISLAVVISLVTLYCVIISIDMNRVASLRKPIFAYEIQMNNALPPNTDVPDVKEISYQGLGYKVEIEINRNEQIIKSTLYMFGKVIVGAIT